LGSIYSEQLFYVGRRLAWPPRGEDLERLYIGEKLFAGKIGKIYGLKEWKEVSNQIHDDVRTFIKSAREEIGPEAESPVF